LALFVFLGKSLARSSWPVAGGLPLLSQPLKTQPISTLLVFAFAVSIALLSGCGSDNDVKKESAPQKDMGQIRGLVKANTDFQFSSSLRDSEKDTIYEDLYTLMNQKLAPADGRAFTKLFGGNSMAVLKYLNQRMHYFIYDDGAAIKIQREVYTDQERDPVSATMLALNLGTLYWIEVLAGKGTSFSFDGTSVPITSSRVGLIGFGDAHFNEAPISRLSTLVHEARHSDCSGGLKTVVVTKIKAANLQADRVSAVADANPNCMYLHVRCPTTWTLADGTPHPLAGKIACDGNEYGPYFVEAAYTSLIANGKCTNCSEEEKQVAKISMMDSLSRVIKIKDYYAGKWAAPDMTSSEIVN